MADNDNTITLVGRIGQEPELRATTKGDVLNFDLATSVRRRGADGAWSDGPTSWFRVAAWHDLARHAHASLHRGQQVIVRGVLTVTEFSLEGGGRSRRAELRATALGHDLRWGTTTFVDGRTAETAPAPEQREQAERTTGWGGTGAAAPAAEEQRRPVAVGASSADWDTALGGEDVPF